MSVSSASHWGDDDRQESTHGECQPNAGDEPIDAVLVRVAAKGVRGLPVAPQKADRLWHSRATAAARIRLTATISAPPATFLEGLSSNPELSGKNCKPTLPAWTGRFMQFLRSDRAQEATIHPTKAGLSHLPAFALKDVADELGPPSLRRVLERTVETFRRAMTSGFSRSLSFDMTTTGMCAHSGTLRSRTSISIPLM